MTSRGDSSGGDSETGSEINSLQALRISSRGQAISFTRLSHEETEAELQKLHEAIAAEKSKLLEEMKIREEQREPSGQLLEAAHSRNRALLHDLRKAEKSLKKRSQVAPGSTIVKLESQYWKSVEQELPKWEQFLLGKSQLPLGMNRNQQKPKGSQTLQTPKRENLPPSGYNSSTFPR